MRLGFSPTWPDILGGFTDLRVGLSMKLEAIEDIEIEKNEDYIHDKN